MAPLVQRTVQASVEWGYPILELSPGELMLTNTAGDLAVVHRAVAVRQVDGKVEMLQMGDNADFGNPYAAAWTDEGHVLGRIVSLCDPKRGVIYDAHSHWWRTVNRAMATSGQLLWRLSQQNLSLRASALRLLRLRGMALASLIWGLRPHRATEMKEHPC